MKYELAKQLDNAGYEFRKVKDGERGSSYFKTDGTRYRYPTLEELIDACGDAFLGLHKHYINNDTFEWYADTHTHPCDCGKEECNGFNWEHETGKTPTEAVAKLWLELNNK